MAAYTRMTRARLYVLVDSFEDDMRQILLRYVLDHKSEDEALGDSLKRAQDRRDADPAGDSVSLVHYLDMREAYDILNRHRDALPAELGRELRVCTPQMDTLVPIRNRVMHGRPLHEGDTEKALSACRAFTTRFWSMLRDTLDRLAVDPSWEPAFNGSEARYSDRILHNLPFGDYDETGLIGRAQDVSKVLRLLLKRRESMLTITGEGGIGKTALAAEVAYNLLDDPASPYECILWVSLKTERLTANGVVEIADAVRDITGATQRLGYALADDFRGGLRELSEALEGVETLLIIDNLETISGDEVVALYEALPDTVTYLMTSRIGVGQIERKIPLTPLSVKDASTLFRSFARSRGVATEYLARYSAETVKQVVTRLRCSPLAIRWWILSVESGREPLPTLTSQEELIGFCVGSVYDALTPLPKEVLTTLYALDRSSTFDEMAVLIDVDVDDLRRAIKELLNGSLVSSKPDPEDELVIRVTLTEAAQHFLRSVAPPVKSDITQALHREQVFRRAEEERRADENRRQLAPSVVRVRSSNDEPTAHLLRLALAQSRRGSFDRAKEFVARARALNPDFWEVDRVEAFILSENHQVDQATARYRAALSSATEDAVPVVSYYFAGHLAGRGHRPDAALPYARAADEAFRSPDTAQLLGKVLLWDRQYSEAQEHLKWAMENLKQGGRLRLIILTSLVESWRRWAESLFDEDKNPVEAGRKAAAGFTVGSRELDSGVWDLKLAESTLESAKSVLRSVTATGIFVPEFGEDVRRVLQGVKRHYPIFERCDAWRHFPGRVGQLHRVKDCPNDIRALCEDLVHISDPGEQASDGGEFPVGIVCSWRGKYGFIAHPDYPSNVFFPASVMADLNGVPGDSVDLVGQRVKFRLDEHGKDDRPRAGWVALHP
ncbi:NB-ARC domain-containing protein [Streptomyces misionensis]|uniref:NB-ARC domain-containing protein n=1 Tax=Streptomyces misionensis TaxID=67331 RepID=UPI0036A7957E